MKHIGKNGTYIGKQTLLRYSDENAALEPYKEKDEQNDGGHPEQSNTKNTTPS
ncbi:hypothetical protein GJ688_08700 [Heliobacillus mobilis]|uniref:Uncharacterized protein n=1 Tax=Heliobacterium mobile TaxID=28064 RepID=A0A6I3SJR6_HELMO|nr:hypothetical protein [Heliobacterium mobile]MTV49056.1 hypothetical protein [Heliobacterium mobile]